MRSSADFRMELPSVGVVLVGTDTMADRGDSWTGDQRQAGTSRWPPVGTWVWPPVDTFSWPGTARVRFETRRLLAPTGALRERREVVRRVSEFDEFSSCYPDKRLAAQG